MELIKVNGRICVITFHSLEDRICKNIFKEGTSVDTKLSHLPEIPEHLLPKFKIIANIVPTDEEINDNNRARSARLRVIERIR
jgi:16S rRNA (cytosine1402-N4)-methyltransferase